MSAGPTRCWKSGRPASCAVVTTDPQTGTANVGAYRIQVQDDGAAVSINMEAGKHGQ
jgi:UbiD family decarboxylase